MEGRGGHFQLAKGGANRETDLAVALLGFASSPGNQAALQTARVTPRSESTTGAPSHLWVGAACELKKMCPNSGTKIGKTTYVTVGEKKKSCLLSKLIHFIVKVDMPTVSIYH